MDPLSQASAWSKLAFETIGRKPIWREWCGGNDFVFISKWETTGGKEVWQPCCLFRSFRVFKSQTHLNHICCFQNDSRTLSAQKPLCCLEAVNLKKWKCYTDKRKATDLAETESSPRCMDYEEHRTKCLLVNGFRQITYRYISWGSSEPDGMDQPHVDPDSNHHLWDNWGNLNTDRIMILMLKYF